MKTRFFGFVIAMLFVFAVGTAAHAAQIVQQPGRAVDIVRVESGDTLWGISSKIIAANPGAYTDISANEMVAALKWYSAVDSYNANGFPLIRPGDELIVPTPAMLAELLAKREATRGELRAQWRNEGVQPTAASGLPADNELVRQGSSSGNSAPIVVPEIAVTAQLAAGMNNLRTEVQNNGQAIKNITAQMNAPANQQPEGVTNEEFAQFREETLAAVSAAQSSGGWGPQTWAFIALTMAFVAVGAALWWRMSSGERRMQKGITQAELSGEHIQRAVEEMNTRIGAATQQAETAAIALNTRVEAATAALERMRCTGDQLVQTTRQLEEQEASMAQVVDAVQQAVEELGQLGVRHDQSVNAQETLHAEVVQQLRELHQELTTGRSVWTLTPEEATPENLTAILQNFSIADIREGVSRVRIPTATGEVLLKKHLADRRNGITDEEEAQLTLGELLARRHTQNTHAA